MQIAQLITVGLSTPQARVFQRLPELVDRSVEYDPFLTDVFYLGNLITDKFTKVHLIYRGLIFVICQP